MVEKLIHWSKVPTDTLKEGAGWRFKVTTQGRLYAIDTPALNGRTTTQGRMKSAIIFTGEAIETFAKHPWATLFCWKRFCGQYWSKEVGDVVWTDADVERPFENVLIVKRCKIVPTNEWPRRLKNRFLRIVPRQIADGAVLLMLLKLLAMKVGVFPYSWLEAERMVAELAVERFPFLQAIKDYISGSSLEIRWALGLLLLGTVAATRVSVRVAPDLRERVDTVWNKLSARDQNSSNNGKPRCHSTWVKRSRSGSAIEPRRSRSRKAIKRSML
ncbi:hypothetical protein [Thalassospira sp. CH_XMU1420-2]|uniref:hypothetical protein n=1 Tax=Thalassospira sp. CH_XMU1420-2 TaxID=3107769 RepID=UPI003009AB38